MKEASFLHFSVPCIKIFRIFATVGTKMQTSWHIQRPSISAGYHAGIKKNDEFLLLDSRFFVSLSAKNRKQPDY